MDELADRMLIVESRLNAQGDQIRNDQRVVEIETAERIAARLQRWGRMLRVWVGLPIAFVMIGLAFFVGKSFVDLADLAATSRRAIEGVLQKAHSEADDAKRNADHALHESAQLEEGIKQLQSSLSVSQAKLSQQSDQVQQLKQNIEAVRSEKNAASLIDIYPGLFGQHVVGTRTGYIDVSRKKPTDIYLTLAVGGPKHVHSSNSTSCGKCNYLTSARRNYRIRGWREYVGNFGKVEPRRGLNGRGQLRDG